jgi:RNA polymerase sigma-70 factor (ECF subfamily)
LSQLTRDPKLPRSTDTDTQSHARQRLVQTLQRVGGGDRAALAELYSATSAKLFGVCLRILPDRSEAEEALQEAYLTIWRNSARFDAARASPITWLVTLTRNRALDRLRGRKAPPLAPLDLASQVADPAEGADLLLEQDQESARLGACLGTLERQDTKLIQAAFFEGSAYSELAARAAMPLGTVKSRIRRALLKLRECLSQ